MAQSLSGIICKSQLQAPAPEMAEGAAPDVGAYL